LSSEDLALVKNNVFRLLGMANFVIKNIEEVNGKPYYVAEFHSLEHDIVKKTNAPIIQWVSEDEYVKAIMLKPKGMELIEEELFVEKRVMSEKIDSIIQLYRLGFARVDSKLENKNHIDFYTRLAKPNL